MNVNKNIYNGSKEDYRKSYVIVWRNVWEVWIIISKYDFMFLYKSH